MIEEIRNIYDFNVIGNIDNGEKVYVCDKLAGEIKLVNDMTVEEYLETMRLSKTDYNRFIFYRIIYPAESNGAAENV